jgi:hypothetical protein
VSTGGTTIRQVPFLSRPSTMVAAWRYISGIAERSNGKLTTADPLRVSTKRGVRRRPSDR